MAKQKDLHEKNKEILEKLKKMTPEEIFQTIVDAGICTDSGELTELYKNLLKKGGMPHRWRDKD